MVILKPTDHFGLRRNRELSLISIMLFLSKAFTSVEVFLLSRKAVSSYNRHHKTKENDDFGHINDGQVREYPILFLNFVD